MSCERHPDDPDGGDVVGGAAGCPRSACLQLFLDGELEPTPASDLEAHLASCGPCAERASLLVAMKSSLRRQCSGRATDGLRARICLAVAHEARPTADGGAQAAQNAQGVQLVGALPPAAWADFAVPATPSRESLLADRALDLALDEVELRDPREGRRGGRASDGRASGGRPSGGRTRGAGERSPNAQRVAYGMGALALAAGMALAVIGDRSDGAGGERVATGGVSVAPGVNGPDDGSSPRQADDAGAGVADRSAHERTAEKHAQRLDAARSAALGMAPGGHTGVPGTLIPIHPQNQAAGGVGVPSLSPSALAGRALAGGLHDDRTTIDAVLDDLVAEHMNPLPPTEMNVARLSRFERAVGVAMRAPRFRNYDARFRGARVLPIRGAQRTAMLTYELPDGERVTVYLWNPQAVPIGTTRLRPRVRPPQVDAEVDAEPAPVAAVDPPIFVGEARGYSIAACERRGIGYALATKRDADESVRMVAATVP